jgi:predicted phage terminase large subunit-like protein
MLQRGWFEIVPASPAQAQRIRYWDKAGTAGGDGARSAGVLMARAGTGPFYIEDVIAGRWGATEREEVIKQTAEADRQRVGRVGVWTEQEPGSGGKESAEGTIRNLAGFVVHAERVTGDKVTRAEPFASQAKAGNVKLVAGQWNGEYLNEVEKFPKGKLKDLVDASSGAFNKLAERRVIRFRY